MCRPRCTNTAARLLLFLACLILCPILLLPPFDILVGDHNFQIVEIEAYEGPFPDAPLYTCHEFEGAMLVAQEALSTIRSTRAHTATLEAAMPGTDWHQRQWFNADSVAGAMLLRGCDDDMALELNSLPWESAIR